MAKYKDDNIDVIKDDIEKLRTYFDIKDKIVPLKYHGEIVSGYYVSENGVVFSTKHETPRIRKAFPNNCGYMLIGLYLHNKLKHFILHRLLYESFVSPIPDGMQVNHIDGNKANNRLTNIELLTASENTQHAYDHGLARGQPGENNNIAKITNNDACSIYFMIKNTMFLYKDIAYLACCDPQLVRSIANGSRWASIVGYDPNDNQRVTAQRYTNDELEIVWFLFRVEHLDFDQIGILLHRDRTSIKNILWRMRAFKRIKMDSLLLRPEFPNKLIRYLIEIDSAVKINEILSKSNRLTQSALKKKISKALAKKTKMIQLYLGPKWTNMS